VDTLLYLVFSDGTELRPVERLKPDQNRYFKKVLRAQ
jgi:hypothetical protein